MTSLLDRPITAVSDDGTLPRQTDKAREKLTSAVTDVWNDSEQAEKLVITVPLLLAPSANSDLSRSECRTVIAKYF